MLLATSSDSHIVSEQKVTIFRSPAFKQLKAIKRKKNESSNGSNKYVSNYYYKIFDFDELLSKLSKWIEKKE